MPFQLVIVRGRSGVKAHRIGPGVTVAGRQDGCQLQIRSSLVSRKHCEVFERNGQLVVKDLESSNGTFVNGAKVEGQRVVNEGDELSIGGVRFRVERAEGSSVTAAKGPADTAPPSPITPVSDSEDAIPIDDDVTLMTTAAPQSAAPAAVAPDEKTTPPSPPATKQSELGEDAVAEFLLDLDLDDDDKA